MARPLPAALFALAAAVAVPSAAPAQGAAEAAVRADPAAAVDRRYDFRLDWGPIHLAEISLQVAEADGATEIVGEGRSVGVASWIADFATVQRVVYGRDARRYAVDSRYGDESSERRVVWDDAGRPEVEVAEADDPDEPRTPIAEAELTGTVDPAFPVWDALARIERGGDCAETYRVYDGVRRFDIILESEGTETLDGDRDWTYAGPAEKCRLRFRRVGGFPAEEERETEEAEYDRHLWIATLADGRAAPVRLRVTWPLGAATGRIDLR